MLKQLLDTCNEEGYRLTSVPLPHFLHHSLIKPSLSLSHPPTPDTSLQLRRDVIFCQAATGALCTLAEQLLAALRSRFNNAGEYQEDGKETSRKWLEQISAIGVLLHFQSTLAPHLVSTEGKPMGFQNTAPLCEVGSLT